MKTPVGHAQRDNAIDHGKYLARLIPSRLITR